MLSDGMVVAPQFWVIKCRPPYASLWPITMQRGRTNSMMDYGRPLFSNFGDHKHMSSKPRYCSSSDGENRSQPLCQ